MKRPGRKRKPLKPFGKYLLAILGLLIVVTGVGALISGALHYTNVWGGAVFAPFALIVGGLVILVAFLYGKS